MEQRHGADTLAVRLHDSAPRGLDVLQLLESGKRTVDQRFITEFP
jgi:hypothetical protein